MTLSKANIITYLLGKGLLTFEQAVKGDIVVIDVTRRNKNLKVVLPGNEGGYFVKQIQAQNPTSVANLRREATCYWLASSHSDFRSMKPLVPKYLYYDTDKNVLITAILPHSMNLTQYYSQNGRFDGTVAKELGKTLGTYHSKINLDPERQQIKDIFPGAVSWILGYHHNGHQLFGNLAGGNGLRQGTGLGHGTGLWHGNGLKQGTGLTPQGIGLKQGTGLWHGSGLWHGIGLKQGTGLTPQGSGLIPQGNGLKHGNGLGGVGKVGVGINSGCLPNSFNCSLLSAIPALRYCISMRPSSHEALLLFSLTDPWINSVLVSSHTKVPPNGDSVSGISLV